MHFWKRFYTRPCHFGTIGSPHFITKAIMQRNAKLCKLHWPQNFSNKPLLDCSLRVLKPTVQSCVSSMRTPGTYSEVISLCSLKVVCFNVYHRAHQERALIEKSHVNNFGMNFSYQRGIARWNHLLVASRLILWADLPVSLVLSADVSGRISRCLTCNAWCIVQMHL